MNIPTIIGSLIILSVFVFIVITGIRRKIKNKGGCSGGCSGCPSSSSCSHK
jgi:hypothetical protein